MVSGGCPRTPCHLSALLPLSPRGHSLSPMKEHFRSSSCPQYQLLWLQLGSPVKLCLSLEPQGWLAGRPLCVDVTVICLRPLPSSPVILLAVSAALRTLMTRRREAHMTALHTPRGMSAFFMWVPSSVGETPGRPPCSVCLCLLLRSVQAVCSSAMWFRAQGRLIPPLQECHTCGSESL